MSIAVTLVKFPVLGVVPPMGPGEGIDPVLKAPGMVRPLVLVSMGTIVASHLFALNGSTVTRAREPGGTEALDPAVEVPT